MIDEYWTWQFYGYHSDELSPHSDRPVVAMCDMCCQYRVVKPRAYRDLCRSCSGIGRIQSAETRRKLSVRMSGEKHYAYGTHLADETKRKISEANKGWVPTDEMLRKISEANKGRIHTYESRRKRSATIRGIPYEEWTEFSTRGGYCEMFDDACRERIRSKHDHKCFICGKTQDQNTDRNGKIWKLAVHHVDMDKGQGCNGVKWKLVPLCMQCHGHVHSKIWVARIEYILNCCDCEDAKSQIDLVYIIQ